MQLKECCTLLDFRKVEIVLGTRFPKTEHYVHFMRLCNYAEHDFVNLYSSLGNLFDHSNEFQMTRVKGREGGWCKIKKALATEFFVCCLFTPALWVNRK